MPTGKRVRLVGIITIEVDVGGMGMLEGWMDDGGEIASTRSEQDLARFWRRVNGKGGVTIAGGKRGASIVDTHKCIPLGTLTTPLFIGTNESFLVHFAVIVEPVEGEFNEVLKEDGGFVVLVGAVAVTFTVVGTGGVGRAARAGEVDGGASWHPHSIIMVAVDGELATRRRKVGEGLIPMGDDTSTGILIMVFLQVLLEHIPPVNINTIKVEVAIGGGEEVVRQETVVGILKVMHDEEVEGLEVIDACEALTEELALANGAADTSVGAGGVEGDRAVRVQLFLTLDADIDMMNGRVDGDSGTFVGREAEGIIEGKTSLVGMVVGCVIPRGW
jgi:hypothetical protein